RRGGGVGARRATDGGRWIGGLRVADQDGFGTAMASRYDDSGRASLIGLTSDHCTTPSWPIRNEPRRAQPFASSKTPYARAISPCGQKSESSGKPKSSCSA